MEAATIGERYSRALLDIGLEHETYEQMGREIDQIAVLVRKSKELGELLRNPKFKAASRRAVLNEIAQRIDASPTVRSFLNLLVDRGRIGYLPVIAERYHALADEIAGRVRARIVVAAHLSESEAARLRTVLQTVTGRQVVLLEREDPSIIGGIITQIGDRVYDGSVRAQLESLRSELKQA